MSIVVTGATGRLGRLVVQELLDRVPGEEVAAVVRDAEKARDLAARSVELRVADYDEPPSLQDVFRAADRVLLVSGNEMGKRIAQHGAVIDAAANAGVALLAYTSVLGGPKATFAIAREHNATERLIRDSGLPHVLLRNGWYNENYTGYLGATLEHGRVFASAGDGRIATAARADYAAAAAVVLTRANQQDAVYELSGDVAWSLAEFAAEVARQSGKDITYRSMPEERYREFMVRAGASAQDADALIDVDAAIARGELAATPGDLRRLIRRPTTPIADSITAALKT